MEQTKPISVEYKNCSDCNKSKSLDGFYKSRSICIDCINFKRREKYNSDEEHRKKLIKMASEFKHEKVIRNQKIKEEEQLKIGIENKKCKYCHEIKNKHRFRFNRLKCRDCERDEPVEKFKRYIRTRIYNCLKNRKTKHSIDYLGCSSDDYFKWIFNYDNNYSIENHGKEWQIDHVIPISKFNLENDDEKMLAFNWRNTMPLEANKNLKKNNKIIVEQVSFHYKKLIEYHKENKLELPQVFIDLFAKYLVDGNPLKPSLLLTSGNICEELG